jgi:hypothetical protein
MKLVLIFLSLAMTCSYLRLMLRSCLNMRPSCSPNVLSPTVAWSSHLGWPRTIDEQLATATRCMDVRASVSSAPGSERNSRVAHAMMHAFLRVCLVHSTP